MGYFEITRASEEAELLTSPHSYDELSVQQLQSVLRHACHSLDILSNREGLPDPDDEERVRIKSMTEVEREELRLRSMKEIDSVRNELRRRTART